VKSALPASFGPRAPIKPAEIRFTFAKPNYLARILNGHARPRLCAHKDIRANAWLSEDKARDALLLGGGKLRGKMRYP